MKFQLCLLCLLASSVDGSKQEVTPVQKVIQLLEGMNAKGKEAKHAEQVQFAAEKQFCDDTQAAKKTAIKEETMNIDNMNAKISKATADAARLSKEIASLNKDEDTWTGDKKAAAKVRAIEKSDYDATHADYSESIDALARAIAVLKKQSHDRAQKSSLAQVSALQSLSLIPVEAKNAIDAFVQEGEVESDISVTAPEANGYEFQSNGVVQMLEKLHDKFIDERTNLEKEEANSKHAHNLLEQDLTAQIDQAVKDATAKSATKSKTLQRKASTTADRNAEMDLKSTDEKYLKDLTAECNLKASDFEARQQLRSEEITTVEKATDILSSGAVSGSADKHLPSLMQKKGSSFGQLRSNANTQIQSHVAQFLHDRAAQVNSRVLEAVASRASVDPFVKVKKMVKDMVVKLMEEANEEAGHKGWCDTELSTNKQTRNEKTQSVETLHSEIDELNASISKLTQDITDLTKAVAELDDAMATATNLRNAEKAKNADTVKDAQEAQTALAQADTVLKEFYAKAAEATSFVQVAAPYKGMQDENGGVLAMLEVIESDFARLESETSAGEASSQKEYDTFMTDSKVDKSAKNTDIEHKTAKKQDQNQALTAKKSDLDGTQKELDAALEYFDKLKPSCVDSGASYDERVAQREQEIESLQEGLKLMSGGL